jgi:hypothetical protein
VPPPPTTTGRTDGHRPSERRAHRDRRAARCPADRYRYPAVVIASDTVRHVADPHAGSDHLDGETPKPGDTPAIGAVRLAVCYASAFGLRYRRGRRGFRSLEGAVEHRQGQHDDADPDQDGADQVHAGVGDVVTEGDSGDRR